MSEPPQTPHAPEANHDSAMGRLRAFRDHAARPELLLPAASLSLGFALILVQPHPLPHPILAYGLMLCVTAALYLYGREITRVFETHADMGTAEISLAQQDSEDLHLTQQASPGVSGLELDPAIDAGSLAALEQSVGLSTLMEIVRSYLAHAEHLIDTLATTAEEEQWPDAVRVAQDIAGAASGLGLSAVTLAARTFAQKAREGANAHELRNTAQMILGEHLRVRRALAELYPSLAA